MAILELTNVSKSFGTGTARTDVLKNISLSVEEGEFLVLLGFSGTGKTTLINLMAGLDAPTSGSVAFRGRPVAGPGPERGVVFQNYSLMPWLTVSGNVGLAVDTVFPGLPKRERAAKAAHYVDMVGLGHAAARRPAELSGGMRQRVNVARALAMNPEMLLLDEPLSALDKKLREEMQLELKRLQHEAGITFLIVTHDQEEALVMADRIAVLNGGRLAQAGTPHELYEHPASRFVAGFIGVMNFLDGTAVPGGVEVPGLGLLKGESPLRGPASIAVRPERVVLLDAPPGGGRNHVPGTVEDVAYHGADQVVHVRAAGTRLAARIPAAGAAECRFARGQPVCCAWAPEHSRILPPGGQS